MHFPRHVRRHLTGLWLAAMAAPPPPAAAAACEFAAVKQAIDAVLDRDAAKAGKFRQEVASGADPIATVEALVAGDMAAKIDICRFEAGEYLAKRGFPPFH
jgi:hypothetical protein